MCMEQFLIDVGKELELPVFGIGGIKDKNDKIRPVSKREDFCLRAVANVAYDEKPVPGISKEDLDFTGYLKTIFLENKSSLEEEEWKKVLFVLSRGGRFEDKDRENQGDVKALKWKNGVALYSEHVARAKNSITGQYYKGIATYGRPSFVDGTDIDKIFPENEWPFRIISYKSRFRSVSTLANVELLREITE